MLTATDSISAAVCATAIPENPINRETDTKTESEEFPAGVLTSQLPEPHIRKPVQKLVLR